MKWLSELPSGFLSFLGKHPAFVDTNPRYEHFLKSQGLNSREDFLALPAIIVSGHPDRHVARVALGAGPNTINGYLKKEHRVPWRDRVANALTGFGFCSKSCREARILRILHASGIRCPEWIAAGEDRQGQAFLLVSELEGAVDIRRFLSDPLASSSRRCRFVKNLANVLARMHDAGFYHRDLYSKHIVVRPNASHQSGFEIYILDWQRACHRPNVSWGRRWQDLATLDASLAESLANSKERLTFLRVYLKTTLSSPVPRPFLLRAIHAIQGQSLTLLRRRKIGEMRLPPLAQTSQQLVWLKGEELCVTREFHQAANGRMPEFLTSWLNSETHPGGYQSQQVIVPGVGAATLIVRRTSHRLRWVWSWIRRRPLISSELQKAALIFRLERHGVEVPKLLAFGQRLVTGGTESFLLTQSVIGTVDFTQWLANVFGPGRPGGPTHFRAALREAGKLLRQMHDAHCYFTGGESLPLKVRAISSDSFQLVLGELEAVSKRHRPSQRLARKNLDRFLRTLASFNVSRSDYLRFLLSYFGQRRLVPHAKRLLRRLLPPTHGLPSRTLRASVHRLPIPARRVSEGLAG